MDERAEIKERLSITEVVQSYLPLKQAGRNLKAPCPFHQEKTASFTVNPERGIYHCFGCNESGDIYSFVMKMDGLDFREALEKLARQAGVELKARRGEDVEASKKRARLLEAHALAVKYFQASLVKNPKALAYVTKKRGLTRQTIKDFQIGYAPDSWNALTDWLAKKGFSQQELIEGGLAGQKQGRNTIYDLFRGRIVFPITDREGRPIGFTARVLDDSLPKYLNTPQTLLYDKSRAIFGLHLAREAVRTTDEVVLVEGNMDVVASHQAGVNQVVAASGTALTLDQLRTLSKLTKNIKLAFDADRAGLAATERAIELGQQLGLTLRMVVLEGAKDADELISKDPAAWEAAIADSNYIVDYLFERFAGDYDLASAIGKRSYADRLAVTLRRLGDPVEQDHYVKRLADAIGTSVEAVRAKLQQRDTTQPANTRATSQTSQATPVTAPRAKIQATKQTLRNKLEDELFAICLLAPLSRIALDDLSAAHFDDENKQRLFEAMRVNSRDSATSILASLGDSDYANQMMFLAETKFSSWDKAKLTDEALSVSDRLFDEVEKVWRRQISKDMAIAETDGDDTRRNELMAKIEIMNRRKT